ncbi:SAGA complex protein [Mycena kentingensis (nom. inval.)]|nr:SAGA complex protein [Mycena kentingensis (nom. inval.)]
MNNLLRSLTQAKTNTLSADGDLRLLLTTVHNARRQAHDSRISDPFYESLEGVLLDLRTTTIDNHDAEAFLKPVSKSEVPDYYDVIKNPMDLQTMLKKVKNKSYKSKAEFKTDLEWIWNNCLTYNAVETHPLRACAMRLRERANRLLANVTDRKERADPKIPAALSGTPTDIRMSAIATKLGNVTVNGAPPTLNGVTVNGIHARPTITIKPPRKSFSSGSIEPAPGLRKAAKVDFGEMPALVRTPEGMRAFALADARMEWEPQVLDPYLPPRAKSDEVVVKTEEEQPDVEAMIGEKRRWNGEDASAPPRKRIRPDVDPDIWWQAVQSDALLANGLPHIPHASSSSRPSHPTNLPAFPHATPKAKPKAKPKTSKAKGKEKADEKDTTLLVRMNNNIRTMRRLRHTHSRFVALGLSSGPGGPGGEDEQQGQPPPPPMELLPAGDDGIAMVGGENELDDRPWGAEVGIGLTSKQWRKRRRKMKGAEEPIEVGSENAEQCMQWMGSKVLEHSGFQGTSKVALDVLASVTSEYLLNVGRTLRFMSDKYGKTMTPEEIILHTLFESGVSHVNELERYVRDDVERYGSRLGDLEKKLVGAYREVTTGGEFIDDDTLFEEDEENDGALTLGDFAEALGEDYLGLRELGIASEFGMSSLSIPKKLLRRRRAMAAANVPAAPPPLPYPLPPPFVPLVRGKVEEQIGLLQPFYLTKFTALAEANAAAAAAAAAAAPPTLPGPVGLPPLPGPSLPSLPGPTLPRLPGPSLPNLPGPTLPGPAAMLPPPVPAPTPTPEPTPSPAQTPSLPHSESISVSPAKTPASTPMDDIQPKVEPMEPPPLPAPKPPVEIPPSMVLPDDAPKPLHMKMGPLGQIGQPNARAAGAGTGTATTKKKKDKDKDVVKKEKGVDEKPKKPKKGPSASPSPTKKKSGGKSDAALMPPPPLPMPMPIVAGV